MDLRIVIVSWNVRDRLRECLCSIAETANGSTLTYDIVVVDNASSDGTAAMVRKEIPWVPVIANTTNRGFAAACNQGIRESPRDSHSQISPPKAPCPSSGGDPPQAQNLSSKGAVPVLWRGSASGAKSQITDFILLLNPDMRVLPGTLDGIVAFMREPRNARVGVAGCHLVDEHGQTVPHARRFPELSDQLAVMLKLPHLAQVLLQNHYPAGYRFCNMLRRRIMRPVDRYLMHDFDYTKGARVDSIRGSFFCIRRACLEQIGLLDEDYFIWFEEVDFCRRARDAGWEVAYTPSVRCVDYVGQSFAQVATARKQRMFTRSMLTYFRKHHAWWKWMVLAVVRPVVVGAAMIRDCVGAGQRSALP